MVKSGWPARTSEPSVKSRRCTMPAARARTCATRDGSSRPGNSVMSPTSPGATVTTPTSGGGIPPPPPAGCALPPWPQAASSAAAVRAIRIKRDEAIAFLVGCGSGPRWQASPGVLAGADRAKGVSMPRLRTPCWQEPVRRGPTLQVARPKDSSSEYSRQPVAARTAGA